MFAWPFAVLYVVLVGGLLAGDALLAKYLELVRTIMLSRILNDDICMFTCNRTSALVSTYRPTLRSPVRALAHFALSTCA